jgi:hypothetical protein
LGYGDEETVWDGGVEEDCGERERSGKRGVCEVIVYVD